MFNFISVLKVRYITDQLAAQSPRTGIKCFGRNIIAQEGFFNGLYRPGIVPNFLGTGIGALGRVGAYPYARDGMLRLYGAQKGEKPAFIMAGAGALTGALGYWVCSPIYQVKTLAQAEAGLIGSCGNFITGSRKN
jgi:hypothetical protein